MGNWIYLLLGPLAVEFIGYFWHRFIEHHGLLGKPLTVKHQMHHEFHYPEDELRTETYNDANSWTWYVLGFVVAVVIGLLLPFEAAMCFGISAFVYAQFIVMSFHSAFHYENHRLWKYAWFQKLVKLHDIHHWDNYNYGICFFGMDKIFGTYREDFPEDKQDIFKKGITIDKK